MHNNNKQQQPNKILQVRSAEDRVHADLTPNPRGSTYSRLKKTKFDLDIVLQRHLESVWKVRVITYLAV